MTSIEPLAAAELPAYPPAGDGRLQVTVDLRDMDRRPLDALRLLLVADVFRRWKEDLQQDRVLVAVLSDAGWLSAAQAAWAKALMVRGPLALFRSPGDAAESFKGPASVAIEPAEPGPAAEWIPARCFLQVGAVTAPHQMGASLTDSYLLRDCDPLAVRLALLRFPYASPAGLSRARLHRAEETLQRWRFKVAGWKDMPAAPALEDTVEAARDALLTGLDTRAVLTLLHRLEVDQSKASGSKFETFTYLDQVLALDLRHLVGKVRG